MHLLLPAADQIDAPLLSAPSPEPKSVRLGFVAGTIQQEKVTPFERLLFRATRGNMYLRTLPVGAVVDPATTDKQEKSVFVVFFAGERTRTKVLKVRKGLDCCCLAGQEMSTASCNYQDGSVTSVRWQ